MANALNKAINQISSGQNYGICLGDFLDSTRLMDNSEMDAMLVDEPNWENLDTLQICYFVASLSRLLHLRNLYSKDWMLKSCYCLEDPYFAANAQGPLRIILMQESPVEFRTRNMYVPENTLFRV